MSSSISSLWAYVDNSISIGDDVEIMFDHDDTIPLLYETIEDIEEFLYIREVESCGRLIEDIECLSCRSLGEVECELDSLGFSSRECGCRLTELYIPKPYIDKDLEDASNTRKSCKKYSCLIDRHIEDLSDIFSLKFYIKCFWIISCPTT